MLKEEILSHLRQFSTAPFLFIGSGMSRRYLNLESWEGLLRRFSGLTDRTFDYYRSTANGDYPRIASKIAERLHEQWWTDEQFAESRELFGEQASSTESALKIEISRYLLNAAEHSTTGSELNEEINCLSNANIDGIITTNWDLFLESIFPDYKVFIGQSDLLFSAQHSVGEIYKIHGSISQPDSLVLTADDYEKFDAINPYLAAKLLTIFVEHPVIFLGYSMNDSNVESILHSIASCLTSDNIEQLANRLIFVQWRKEQAKETIQQTTFNVGKHYIPVSRIETSSFLPIFEALSETRRRFPAALLRKLKEHIYELVRDHDPNEQLSVQDIEDDSLGKDIEVVVGVGAISEIGYKPLTRFDLLRDVLYDDRNFNAKRVVSDVLPTLLKSMKNTVPVFKYLSRAGWLGSGDSISEPSVGERVRTAVKGGQFRAEPPASERDRHSRYIDEVEPSFYEIIDLDTPYNALSRIALLDPSEIPIEGLRDYLLNYEHLLDGDLESASTPYFKAICLYDYLVYSNEV